MSTAQRQRLLKNLHSEILLLTYLLCQLTDLEHNVVYICKIFTKHSLTLSFTLRPILPYSACVTGNQAPKGEIRKSMLLLEYVSSPVPYFITSS